MAKPVIKTTNNNFFRFKKPDICNDDFHTNNFPIIVKFLDTEQKAIIESADKIPAGRPFQVVEIKYGKQA